jgi:opacity protein-like surface antigen
MRKGILSYTALTALSVCLMADANAVATGFYMGVMTGPSSNSASKQQATTESGTPPTVTVKPSNKQWGTRVYLGNKFNPYAGIEAGMTYFSTINYNNTSDEDTCSATNVKVRDIDVVGKGDYTFGGFGLFGKAGIAFTYVTTSGGLEPPVMGKSCGASNRQIKYRPTFTIGASYDLDQSWVADLSYTKIMVGSTVSTVSFLALGISYHFVDRYCGQFLCSD